MSRLLFDSFDAVAVLPVAPPALPYVSAYEQAMLAADRAIMMLLGGQPVIYAPLVGAPVTITGIFDRLFVLVRSDPPAGVEATSPAVFLRLEDIPADPDLDDPTLTIAGVDYQVIERMPDGIGGIVLELRTVA